MIVLNKIKLNFFRIWLYKGFIVNCKKKLIKFKKKNNPLKKKLTPQNLNKLYFKKKFIKHTI